MPLSSSDTYKKAVKYSHRIRSRGILLRSGVPDYSIDLGITEGNVSEDSASDIRGKCDLTLVDKTGSLSPTNTTDPLFPGYNEIQLFRGLYLPDGTLEEKSLGVYSFDQVDASNIGQGQTIRISGFDRAQRISDAKFLSAVTYSGAIGTIIQSIVLARLPFATFNFQATPYTVNRVTYSRGDDPWKACLELTAAAGMYLFFARDGSLTMQSLGSSASPDWTFASGVEATLLNIGRQLSRQQYNHWVEIAEGGDIVTPFLAEARDDADIAATGDRPTFHVSSFYTSLSQAQAAADGRKAQEMGATEKIQVNCIPNPAILINDLVSLQDTRTRINNLYFVDKVTTPLRANQGQYFTTRVRNLLS